MKEKDLLENLNIKHMCLMMKLRSTTTGKKRHLS